MISHLDRLPPAVSAAALGLALVACGGGEDTVDAGPVVYDAELASDTSPGKRSDIGGAIEPSTGSALVFGGDNGPIINQTPSPAFLGDTWTFAPGLGWTERDPATAPSARGRHAVAAAGNSGDFYLFGGRYRPSGQSGDYQLYNDLWRYDSESIDWTLVDDGSGDAPAPRYFAAAGFDSDSSTLYVWGGGTNTDPLALRAAADLWAYDGDTWSEITTSGQAPSSRLFTASTFDTSRKQMIVFGGQVGDFFSPGYRDLYALDVVTGQWSLLHSGSSDTPSGRFSAMLTYDVDGDRYLLFGGHADPGVANDLWAFSPSSSTWTLVRGADEFTGSALGCANNSREIPKDYVTEDVTAPERRSGGLLGWTTGQVWLFGGESDCSDHLDDTWRFALEAGEWVELLGATSGESCARRNFDCSCLCL